MLTVRDLSAFYGGIAAVRGASLTVAAGKCVALIGSNGAGKTTLLNAICGASDQPPEQHQRTKHTEKKKKKKKKKKKTHPHQKKKKKNAKLLVTFKRCVGTRSARPSH